MHLTRFFKWEKEQRKPLEQLCRVEWLRFKNALARNILISDAFRHKDKSEMKGKIVQRFAWAQRLIWKKKVIRNVPDFLRWKSVELLFSLSVTQPWFIALDCKIKPVNPKGNRSWILIGRTDAEALILCPSDAKTKFIRNDPDTAEDWRQGEKWVTENEMVGWLNGHEFEQTLGDGQG